NHVLTASSASDSACSEQLRLNYIILVNTKKVVENLMNYVTIMLQVFKQSSCLMFKEVLAAFCGKLYTGCQSDRQRRQFFWKH
ncbi:MAG: hypothetical protein ACI4CZ_08080, partial [Hominisplanchenecus sp.]